MEITACAFVRFVVNDSPIPLSPVGRAVHRDMLQHFAGHVVFQFDARHRFVGAFRHWRERPVGGLVASTIMPEVLISSRSDGSRKLPRNSGFKMIDLEMRLHAGRDCPENVGRIENVDVLVEHEDVFRVIEGQAAAAARAGSPSDIFFIEMKTL